MCQCPAIIIKDGYLVDPMTGKPGPYNTVTGKFEIPSATRNEEQGAMCETEESESKESQ